MVFCLTSTNSRYIGYPNVKVIRIPEENKFSQKPLKHVFL